MKIRLLLLLLLMVNLMLLLVGLMRVWRAERVRGRILLLLEGGRRSIRLLRRRLVEARVCCRCRK